MGSRHPWEITLREFVEKARRDYGIEIDPDHIVKGMVFARKGDLFYALPKIGLDDILPPIFLRALCQIYGLPPLDFHLDPEDDD
jgi:hypothetical protein